MIQKKIIDGKYKIAETGVGHHDFVKTIYKINNYKRTDYIIATGKSISLKLSLKSFAKCQIDKYYVKNDNEHIRIIK